MEERVSFLEQAVVLGRPKDGGASPLLNGKWLVSKAVATGGTTIPHGLEVGPADTVYHIVVSDTCVGGAYETKAADASNIYLTARATAGVVTLIAFQKR